LAALLDAAPYHAAEVGRHRDEHGDSPIHIVAESGNLDALDLLLKANPALIYQRMILASSPLRSRRRGVDGL
jgi:ankyrin repeat protein